MGSRALDGDLAGSAGDLGDVGVEVGLFDVVVVETEVAEMEVAGRAARDEIGATVDVFLGEGCPVLTVAEGGDVFDGVEVVVATEGDERERAEAVVVVEDEEASVVDFFAVVELDDPGTPRCVDVWLLEEEAELEELVAGVAAVVLRIGVVFPVIVLLLGKEVVPALCEVVAELEGATDDADAELPVNVDAIAEIVGDICEGERGRRDAAAALTLGDGGFDDVLVVAVVRFVGPAAVVMERVAILVRFSDVTRPPVVDADEDAPLFVVLKEPCIFRTVPAWMELRLGEAPRLFRPGELEPPEPLDLCLEWSL